MAADRNKPHPETKHINHKTICFLRTAFLLASLALLVYLLKWSIERTCSRCSRSKLDRCHRTTRCRSWTDSLTSTATVSTHNTLCTCWRTCVKQSVDVDYFRKSRCYNKGWTISLIENCASILRHSPLCDHLEQAWHLSQETQLCSSAASKGTAVRNVCDPDYTN